MKGKKEINSVSKTNEVWEGAAICSSVGCKCDGYERAMGYNGVLEFLVGKWRQARSKATNTAVVGSKSKV